MAALMVFTVTHGNIRLKVRVLPTIRDVSAEYKKAPADRREYVGSGKIVNAFFLPTNHKMAKHTGTIVLPADGRLEELIPHEVTHAVMDKLGCVHCGNDESMATAVGVLSARIFKRIDRIGVTA